jgi:hypothetical protein
MMPNQISTRFSHDPEVGVKCHDIGRIIRGAGSQLSLKDDRNSGREIEVAFTGQLEARQSGAVSALLAHEDVCSSHRRARSGRTVRHVRSWPSGRRRP